MRVGLCWSDIPSRVTCCVLLQVATGSPGFVAALVLLISKLGQLLEAATHCPPASAQLSPTSPSASAQLPLTVPPASAKLLVPSTPARACLAAELGRATGGEAAEQAAREVAAGCSDCLQATLGLLMNLTHNHTQVRGLLECL